MLGIILRWIAEKWLWVPIAAAILGLIMQAFCSSDKVFYTVDQ